MAKNIILCADGTGNKGGVTPDSNVYKIYKAINKHAKGITSDGFKFDEQILFYDNGVGTEKNKYHRALGGGLGFGFEDNVCDLYKFLARNYEPGDRIYFFGFSRGASTVRACNGFISKCGLAKGKRLRNSELDALVKEAFAAYKLHEKYSTQAKSIKKSDCFHSEVPIYFMGIWDTVVALGFPKRTDVTGPVSLGINILSYVADKILDWKIFWPHSFYYYRLTGNVLNAYQALAIDDERTAFWPFVWGEPGTESGGEKSQVEPQTVEQVWFAGMHSNVGGSYGRSGLASVPLYWMMLRAEKSGLKFEDNAVQQVFDDSHVHGRMYNSRDGAGILYRYHPREIEKLCAKRIDGNIKIHRSVIERMEHRTANYAPGHLPGTFDVVEDDPDVKSETRYPGKCPEWPGIRKEIDKWEHRRKGLYAVMLSFVLTVFYASWILDAKLEEHAGFWGKLGDAFDYVLPDFFSGLIEVAVIQHPSIFIGAAILVCVYVRIRRYCRKKTVEACERLRHLIIT